MLAGLALVLIFMLVYYKVFGLLANIALGLNLVLLVAVMSMLSATLTLPGIAGIVLTVGMAVDANVLIFSRIKEELARELHPQQAISGGFDRAFVTGRQPDHLDCGGDSVRGRHWSGSGLCGDLGRRYLYVDVHGDFGNPRSGESDLRPSP